MTTTILFVIGDLDIGGAERHLTQILPFLAKSNLRPVVYTLTHKGRLAHQVQSEGIEVKAPPFADRVRRLPKGVRPLVSLPLATTTLFWLMWWRRPDIVHFFLPASYLIGGLCSLVVGPRVRIMSRRSLNDYQHNHPILTRLEPWLHRRMTAVIGNSRAVVAQLANEGVPADRLGLIYNGIDLKSPYAVRSRAEVRASLDVAENALVLTNVANLMAYKGHADLVNALATVAGRLPEPWVLLCVGRDTGVGESLRQLTKTLGLERNVHWLGERQDVSDILNASDIGLLCSHQEGFSNTVLEGMAAGLPMVVTDVGGNREAVIDGLCGHVVPPRDTAALGTAVVALADDPSERHRMGKAARERVSSAFSLTECVRRYERLYLALAVGSRQPVADILAFDRA